MSGRLRCPASAKDALEKLELFREQFEHPAVRLAFTVQEIDDHHVVLLPVTVTATDALLDALGVPREIMSGFILLVQLACRVPNALAIAVFGGVMDLLPYIGIFLTMGPAVLAASVKGAAIAGIVFALLLAYEELESRVLVPLVYGRALRLPSWLVLFSLIVGTTLGGIVGALLALPIAATVLMLVEELRVELPGETTQPADIEQRRKDDRTEQEYKRRTESMPAEQAAIIAVEISGERKKAEGEAGKAKADSNGKDGPSPVRGIVSLHDGAGLELGGPASHLDERAEV